MSLMATSLGEAAVEIIGDFGPLVDSLSSAMDDAGAAIAADLSSAFDGATDGLAAEFGAAGSDAGGALVDEVESAVDGLDIDADFSDLSAAADQAGSDVSSAMADAAQESESVLGGALSGLSEQFGSLQGVIATVSGGAGLEGFARAQLPLTEQSRRLAAGLELSEEEVRNLALASSDVTRPLSQVLDTMEIGRQQGIRNADQLMDFVAAWDLVGDATGLAASDLAALSPALAAVGIDATEVEEAYSAFGFMTENTTMDVGEFMDIINRLGPDLREMGLDIDDTAAFLGAMQGELGMTGRVARTEFRRAVTEADGDMGALLETLGLSEEQFGDYRAQVDESSGILERNADIHAESYTVLQRGQAVVTDLMFRFGGLADVASMVAGPLAALGPVMMGVQQVGGVLGRVMPILGNALRGVAAAFRVLTTAILTNPIFLIAALIIGIIAAIWYFRDEIIGALGAAWEWLRGAVESVWEFVTDIFDTAVETVVGFVMGMVDTIVETVSGWVDTVVEFVTGLWESFTGLVMQIHDAVIGFFVDLVATVIETVSGWVSDLVGFVTDLWETYVRIVTNIHDAVVGFFRDLVRTVVDTVSGWVSDLVGFVTNLWDEHIRIVSGIRDSVIEFFTGMVSTVVDTVSGWVSDLVGFVQNLWDDFRRIVTGLRRDVIDFFAEMISSVIDSVSGWVSDMVQFVVDLASDWIDNIRDLIGDVLQFFVDLPGDILSALGDLGSLLLGVGESIVQGMIDGIGNMAGRAVDAVRDVGRRMREGITGFFSIGSPSKMFAEQVGVPLVEGIVAGMDEATPEALAEIERFANQATVMAGSVVGATSAGSTSRQVTVNVSGEVRPIDEERLATLLRRQERLEGLL